MIPDKKLLLSLLVLILLVSSGENLFQQTATERQINLTSKLDLVNRTITNDYTIHDPITVKNDIELAAVASKGNGTINDPYIIESWNITGSSTNGIHITGTTKHFRIENCWINGPTQRGIFVDSITTGTATIINNTCNNNILGIFLRFSDSSTLANNTCNNNGDIGISLYYSGSSILTNNTCNNISGGGIRLDHSPSSSLNNNTCNNNKGSGISLWNSNSSTVTNNICNANGDRGLYFQYSESLIVANNTCYNNRKYGISLYQSKSSTIVNNTCNYNKRGGISLSQSGSSTVTNNSFFNDGLIFMLSSKEDLLTYT
ncbi:MAG: right-handed parallel beta-helix repeat-containing protein, partial [Candidatus Hodarchaeales archaeon]